MSDRVSLLHALQPQYGVGVDLSAEMIEAARIAHPEFKYYEAFPEDFASKEKFDYVLFCDIGDTVDVQKALSQLHTACERHTRLIIYGYNNLWEPLRNLCTSVPVLV